VALLEAIHKDEDFEDNIGSLTTDFQALEDSIAEL
jgi:hypothetical protein